MQQVPRSSYLSTGLRLLTLLLSVQVLAAGVWGIQTFNIIVDYKLVQMFATIFVSILLEAIPFILLGVIVSSLIQVFISEEFIARTMPKHGFKGIMLGITLGFFFPVCDCSIIPVVRRLIKKGVPLYIAITFMLGAPILNPVVLLSTLYAFDGSQMLFYRTFLGAVIAVLIALMLNRLFAHRQVLKGNLISQHQCGCNSCHNHSGKRNRLLDTLSHVEQEFFDVGKFLIIGASIASLSQVILPREILLSAGQNQGLSLFIMMLFAFVISLCSTSDSFIARTFIGQFTNSSILGFLILGPMLDLKNTVVLFGNFKARFVVGLIVVTFTVVFSAVYLTDQLLGL